MKGKGSYIKDINEKSIKDLVKVRNKLRGDLYKLEMKHAVKGLQKIHEIRQLKKNIARVSTVLTNKIKFTDGGSR